MQANDEQESDWPFLLGSHIREKGRFYNRLAYGVLRNTEDAAEVCQQAFLRAWEHRDRIHQQRSLGSWLARVVINESYSRLRHGQTERRMLERRTPPSSGNSQPDELAERRDLVVAALARLSEPIREIVTLRAMQGMSGNEVSAMLEVSPSDVSRRLHEGLDQLRRFLSDGRESGG